MEIEQFSTSTGGLPFTMIQKLKGETAAAAPDDEIGSLILNSNLNVQNKTVSEYPKNYSEVSSSSSTCDLTAAPTAPPGVTRFGFTPVRRRHSLLSFVNFESSNQDGVNCYNSLANLLNPAGAAAVESTDPQYHTSGNGHNAANKLLTYPPPSVVNNLVHHTPLHRHQPTFSSSTPTTHISSLQSATIQFGNHAWENSTPMFISPPLHSFNPFTPDTSAQVANCASPPASYQSLWLKGDAAALATSSPYCYMNINNSTNSRNLLMAAAAAATAREEDSYVEEEFSIDCQQQHQQQKSQRQYQQYIENCLYYPSHNINSSTPGSSSFITTTNTASSGGEHESANGGLLSDSGSLVGSNPLAGSGPLFFCWPPPGSVNNPTTATITPHSAS